MEKVKVTEHMAFFWVVNVQCIVYRARTKRVVKGIFVTRDRPFFFPGNVNQMANFFLMNRDFHSSREV